MMRNLERETEDENLQSRPLDAHGGRLNVSLRAQAPPPRGIHYSNERLGIFLHPQLHLHASHPRSQMLFATLFEKLLDQAGATIWPAVIDTKLHGVS